MCCSYDRPEVIPITEIINRYTNNLLPLINTAINNTQLGISIIK